MDNLGSVDILMIPVGGGSALEAKGANELIASIEPRIVIPMSYQIPGLKAKVGSVENFIKISGLPEEKMEKFKVAKKDLPQDETRVVILNV